MCAPIENRRLPAEPAPADDAFLHVLIIMDAPPRPYRHGCAPAPGQTPRNKEPPTPAAVVRPKTRHADATKSANFLRA
jgi:hypothetical protein